MKPNSTLNSASGWLVGWSVWNLCTPLGPLVAREPRINKCASEQCGPYALGIVFPEHAEHAEYYYINGAR